MALYSRGKYDEAVKALIAGADLIPSDARCFYFLSKAYDSSPNQAEDVIQHFRRFSELQPEQWARRVLLRHEFVEGETCRRPQPRYQ